MYQDFRRDRARAMPPADWPIFTAARYHNRPGSGETSVHVLGQ